MKRILSALLVLLTLVCTVSCNSATPAPTPTTINMPKELTEENVTGEWKTTVNLSSYLSRQFSGIAPIELNIDPIDLYLKIEDGKVEYRVSKEQYLSMITETMTEFYSGIENSDAWFEASGLTRSEWVKSIEQIKSSDVVSRYTDISKMKVDNIYIILEEPEPSYTLSKDKLIITDTTSSLTFEMNEGLLVLTDAQELADPKSDGDSFSALLSMGGILTAGTEFKKF